MRSVYTTVTGVVLLSAFAVVTGDGNGGRCKRLVSDTPGSSPGGCKKHIDSIPTILLSFVEDLVGWIRH